MSYADAIAYLYSLRLFGTKFGLENPLRLAELAGNPQRQLRFIHVAGTNGKGSTCAMLESVHRAAGLKTGLFTSPHLISFCERIQVNRVPIREAEVVRLVSELQPVLASFSSEAHPTFFEVVTIVALKYFAEQQCEIVIWETGLGGRLDATNIVTPLASVITNVQRDHEQWLGQTLAEIAFEKAGIIKTGVPVITGADSPEALAVIEKIARERSAPLTVVESPPDRGVHAASTSELKAGSSADSVPTDIRALRRRERRGPAASSINMPLPGEHQRKNAAVALATIDKLQKILPVSDDAIRRGLETVSWPGRLQLIKTPAGQSILLDGAHNPDGALALREALPQIFPSGPDCIILGMLRDKNCHEICGLLAPLAPHILLTAVQSDRTAAPEDLARFCAEANPTAEIVVCTSLAGALERCSRGRASPQSILITGSLYLIGEALELLEAEPLPKKSERGLNDWSAAAREQCH